jgi:hypothetical protein
MLGSLKLQVVASTVVQRVACESTSRVIHCPLCCAWEFEAAGGCQHVIQCVGYTQCAVHTSSTVPCPLCCTCRYFGQKDELFNYRLIGTHPTMSGKSQHQHPVGCGRYWLSSQVLQPAQELSKYIAVENWCSFSISSNDRPRRECVR